MNIRHDSDCRKLQTVLSEIRALSIEVICVARHSCHIGEYRRFYIPHPNTQRVSLMTQTIRPTTEAIQPERTKKQKRKAFIGAIAGHLIEWYDYGRSEERRVGKECKGREEATREEQQIQQ